MDSQWTMSSFLFVGSSGTGSLEIADGGAVSNAEGIIGRSNGSTGNVLVTGSGSTWTNSGNLILGGNSLINQTTGTGTLRIEDGGFVEVGGSLKVWDGSALKMEVFGNGGLDVGGDVSNDGLMQFTAMPNLTAGAYQPVTFAGDWNGGGTVQAIGGTWNAATHELIVAAAEQAASGQPSIVDLTTTQRLQITGANNRQVLVAFNQDATGGGGNPSIEFAATQNLAAQIPGENVLSAWDFATNLDLGTEVQLSLQIGGGWDPALLAVWHSDDNGVTWTPFETQIIYDGTFASFFVDGFSSYAVTGIPEPSATLLLLVTGGAWVLGRKRAFRSIRP